MRKPLTVIDFFCGAGGFSEGFKQEGFNITNGYDIWELSIKTHNWNHNLDDEPINILDYEDDYEKIQKEIPNSDVIIGSPPCVSFSMSNKAGKADKSLGLRLIETYLQIIVVKKFQPKSKLKAWLMENVPNSQRFVEEEYSFRDLRLEEFAKSIKVNPDDIALKVKENGSILNAANFGAPQARKRFICGEITKTGDFPFPQLTNSNNPEDGKRPSIMVKDIKRALGSPFDFRPGLKIIDPLYEDKTIDSMDLIDHYYDTGVYEVKWFNSRNAKVNHPFMGKMAFPENEERPSRTIMATRSASTREAILYRTEIERDGDGQYRLPTIREAATLMGFPINYQFLGGESSKWKQIGNAVCPPIASALARRILELLDYNQIQEKILPNRKIDSKIINLNSNKRKTFHSPPRKKKGAKFRQHPFKNGNMTIALMNFNPNNKASKPGNGKWFAVLYKGAGKKYDIKIITTESLYLKEEMLQINDGATKFIAEFKKLVIPQLTNGKELQSIYESNELYGAKKSNPLLIVEDIRELVERYASTDPVKLNGNLRIGRESIPENQLFSIWAIKKLVEVINLQSTH